MRSLWENPIRPLSAMWAISVFLALVSILSVGSESREIRPSDHGLANQKNPEVKSPAMAAFFKGAPSDMSLPKARNLSDPFWGIAGVTPATTLGHVRKEGGGHVRVVLLVASLASGAVGVGLLVAALVAYLLHVKRSKS
ncbi:hypothetical protein MRB53_020602 [Persea americana]|uniref:Uncharacterized protein n=1 Tax=Persea americana TaxID=3435 RepID=A0ACC2L1W0_PERAE|nr:hypothetical protein MRB53_020602 [Persea americana]